MKMNKTRLLEKISIQSGVSLDECGTVLKTFEKVLSEELSRKMYRYGGWILLLTALFVSVTVFSQTTGRKGRPMQTIRGIVIDGGEIGACPPTWSGSIHPLLSLKTV